MTRAYNFCAGPAALPGRRAQQGALRPAVHRAHLPAARAHHVLRDGALPGQARAEAGPALPLRRYRRGAIRDGGDLRRRREVGAPALHAVVLSARAQGSARGYQGRRHGRGLLPGGAAAARRGPVPARGARADPAHCAQDRHRRRAQQGRGSLSSTARIGAGCDGHRRPRRPHRAGQRPDGAAVRLRAGRADRPAGRDPRAGAPGRGAATPPGRAAS